MATQNAINNVQLNKAANLSDLADLQTANVNTQFEGVSLLGDASKTMTADERIVEINVALTANRQIQLPDSNALNAGREVIIVDSFGALSLSTPRIVTVIADVATSNTLNGVLAGQYIMRIPHSAVKFIADGAGGWDRDVNYADRYDASLLGTPTTPTATLGTNTTQIASTAFVQAAIVASQTDVLQVSQSAHGFVKGDIIYCIGGSTFAKSQANAASTAVPGFMVIEKINDDLFRAAIPFNYVSGLSGLTAGGQYFLSAATAGAMTLTEPAQPNISAPVFVALTTTTGIFFPQRPRVKNGQDGVATDFVIPALDADLQTIAGLTATTDNFIQSKAGAWASRTVAQVKADLGAFGMPFAVYTGTTTIANATSRFLSVAGGGFQTTAAPANMQPSMACIISNIKVKTNGTQPGTGSLVIISYKNSAPGASTITVAAGSAAGYFTDAVNSDSLAATDEICYQGTNNASTLSAPILYVNCTIR